MSDSDQLVYAGNKRLAVSGIELPSPPPTRIYISGYEYRVQAPRLALPPIANVAKLVFNWKFASGLLARNIMYALAGSGSTGTTDPVWLKALANHINAQFTGSVQPIQSLSSNVTLQSITAKDMSGTSAQATSDLPPAPGVVSPPTVPPQSAVVLSWQVGPTWRGGKPRMYLPGFPQSAVTGDSFSSILPAAASNLELRAGNFLTGVQGVGVSGVNVNVGMVSYYHAHALRPTPLFYEFLGVRVHERLDSQRRRSGKESAYPSVP